MLLKNRSIQKKRNTITGLVFSLLPSDGYSRGNRLGKSACSVSEDEAGANALSGGKIKFEIVFPAIEKAGKSLTIEMYPGENHGFCWGNQTSEETVIKVVSTARAFIDPLLKTKPAC
ncbi:MAG: hypothetical protein L7V87_15440 [Verrucomicrobiales bacterium]|jgi:hypothetical protein|nr:hypothetical protein [Verrucomicrobiales bacterium]